MKKNYEKILQQNLWKMDLLKDLKMSLLSFNFVMIDIVRKMLVLIENNLNYLTDTIFECFLRSTIYF